jgi:spore coat polysaccharide biosynthesis protein SpsF
VTSEQEDFWAGTFGDTYSDRNVSEELIASNTALFSEIFKRVRKPDTVLEFGANIGLNLTAIANLLPNAQFTAVEINAKAAQLLRLRMPRVDVHNTSISTFDSSHQFDVVLFKGVLIHISPDQLKDVLQKAIDLTARYLIICEYYSPRHEMIPYRGHEDRMYRADFAGMALELTTQLSLLDYGFVYHRDPMFALDDISWFVLEKRRL